VRLAFNAALVGLLLGASGLAVPKVAVAEGALAVGGMATVAGTEGAGLRVRSGPGTRYPVQIILAEGRTVPIVDGPVTTGGVTWYRVKTRGPTGWVMARYLAPPVAVPRATGSSSGSAGSGSSSSGSGAGAPRSFVAKITSYSSGEPGVGTRTATGTTVRWGVVSVDPQVIPLGSELEIEGFGGRFVAEDTGGAVRGAQVDVWLPDVEASYRFGAQYRRVTVLREGSGR
jgi:3D (Asp-Asp-Asp) domain-containing protein